MIAHILSVLCCFLIDQILIVLFPSSYLLQQMLFVPSLGFCAVLITVRKFDMISAILFSILFGFVHEFFFTNTFMLYPIIFTLCVLILKYWSKEVGYSMIETIILCIILVFMKDLMVYLYMYCVNQTNLSFVNWMCNMEVLSIVVNSILVIFIILIIAMKDHFLEKKSNLIRSEERLTLEIFKQRKK